MQGSTGITFLSLLLASSALGTTVSPLGEVVVLLDSLAAKITADGEKEAKAYKEYFEWCDDASTQKGFDIKTATSTKEGLEADITKASATMTAAAAKIEELAGSISADGAQLKEAADFAASEAELVDVIDTLTRAIGIVEKQMAKNPSAFVQLDTSNLDNLIKSLSAVVDAAALPSADKRKLLGLVQSQQSAGADDEETGAPAAAVYKTSSTGVVDVLEDLKEKAEEQLSSLRTAEATASHNFDMMKQSLEDEIAADTKAMDAEKATKAAAEEAKATAEGDLSVTVKTLEDGEAALEEIHTSCMRTAADHEATVASRGEELAVLAKAKAILTSTTSGAAAQTYSMLQVSRMQTRADLAKSEVVTIVKQLARKEGSTALSQLASRIAAVMQYGASAGEDPFTKVKGLITGLISKLEADAANEASEKAYCDEQMTKTEAKKAEIEEDLGKLSTAIDKASAKSTSLKEEVKKLQAELAALAKSQADADEIRAESHSDYTVAKADLEEGLAGVRKALGVLRDYYGSSAAMLQEDFPHGTWNKTGLGAHTYGACTTPEGRTIYITDDYVMRKFRANSELTLTIRKEPNPPTASGRSSVAGEPIPAYELNGNDVYTVVSSIVNSTSGAARSGDSGDQRSLEV